MSSSNRGTILRSSSLQDNSNRENVPNFKTVNSGGLSKTGGPVIRQGGRAAFGDLSNAVVLPSRNSSIFKNITNKQAFTIFEDSTSSSSSSLENASTKLPIHNGQRFFKQQERQPFREVKEKKTEAVVSDFWAEKVAKLPFVPRDESNRAALSVKSYSAPGLNQSLESQSDREYSPMVLDNSINEEEDAEISSSSKNEWRVPPTTFSQVIETEEYSLDIFRYLKETETKLLPKWNYMTKQPDINFMMRSILVDWLVEVAEEYKLCTETLYLAVNYIDRFLSYMSVQRAKLQLVGTACMFIAAKYEEIYPPEVHEFTYITDDTYNKKQVLRMEHLVLKVLGFDLTIPSAFFFVNHFSKLSKSSDKVTFLAQYLSELTLLDAERYLLFTPSIIGASAITLARHNCQITAWPQNMIEFTGYAVKDFECCLVNLQRTFVEAPKCQQQAMREKYRADKYLRVSEISPIPLSSSS